LNRQKPIVLRIVRRRRRSDRRRRAEVPGSIRTLVKLNNVFRQTAVRQERNRPDRDRSRPRERAQRANPFQRSVRFRSQPPIDFNITP